MWSGVHLPHRRSRVLAAWRSGVSVTDVPRWIRAGGALSGVMVASMASLMRGCASVLHPGVELAERGVEVISGACAQGAYFGYHRESTMAIAETQGLDYLYSVILVGWCFDTYLWRLQLYDRSKAFCIFFNKLAW
jgi:hypothetical protein